MIRLQDILKVVRDRRIIRGKTYILRIWADFSPSNPQAFLL